MKLYFELNDVNLIKRSNKFSIFIEKFLTVNFSTNLQYDCSTSDKMQNVFKDLHSALLKSNADAEGVVQDENNGETTKLMLYYYLDFIRDFKLVYGYNVHLEYFSTDEYTNEYAIVLDADVNELLKNRVDDYTWLRDEFDLTIINK